VFNNKNTIITLLFDERISNCNKYTVTQNSQIIIWHVDLNFKLNDKCVDSMLCVFFLLTKTILFLVYFFFVIKKKMYRLKIFIDYYLYYVIKTCVHVSNFQILPVFKLKFIKLAISI